MMSTTADNNLYLSGGYAAHNPGWHIEDSPWKSRKIIEVIPDHILNTLPGSVCIVDVGCGAGEILKRTSEFLKIRGQRVESHGYDISHQAISRARRYFPRGIFHQEEFSRDSLKRQNHPIDILLMIDILEHLPHPEKLLMETAAASRYAVCHIPLEQNLEVRLRGLRARFKKTVGHLHFYTKESAAALLENNGFRIERMIFTCLDYDAGCLMKSLPRRLIAQPLRRAFFKRHPDFTARILGNCSLMLFLRSRSLQ